MSSPYQAQHERPFHISAGAVVVNDEGKILVHKRMREKAPPQFADNFVNGDDVYIHMRESLEKDETLEQAATRGLKEEFGMTTEVGKYLGTLSVRIRTGDPIWEWEKTTLYFQAVAGEQGERVIDSEAFSILEWHEPEFLIEHMRGQGGEDRKDLDESKIIENYVACR
jgi:ADP-ribose pyrophosphatase YjhB (NUDIX family)